MRQKLKTQSFRRLKIKHINFYRKFVIFHSIQKGKKMKNIERLESEIKQLNRDELAAFRNWFKQFDADEWDREIEEDALNGKFDKLVHEAISAHNAGRTKEI